MKRIFPKGTRTDDIIKALATMVAAIDTSKAWCISVEPWKRKRSDAQNRFLWGVVYPMILEQGGETLGGWTRDDLHGSKFSKWLCPQSRSWPGFGHPRTTDLPTL